MNVRSVKLMRVPPLAAGVAAILLGAAAMSMAAFAGFGRDSSVGPAVASAPESPGGSSLRFAVHPAPAKVRCDECVVIASMRVIAAEGDVPAMSEITVRLRNGSTRVLLRALDQAGHANWRRGEQIVLIGGTAERRQGKSVQLAAAAR